MKIVRVESIEQLNQAFDIRVEVFVNEQGVPRELEMDEYDASPDACHHFLVLDGELPVATGRFKEYEPGVAKMQRIAVMKSLRGSGVGKYLVLGMEKAAKELGFKTSLLDAQCSAEAFYLRLGYRTISEEPFLDADILHVRMVKPL
ncbi:GNAT family N-acetyltransferase [Cohnella lupini]|uniref:Putative GNAT family N-acyltransferase n=1 Tax=Cohnella lupini TaxID=1294267 RepID=A0A3D9IEM6_9BACL|nr:GNAT family N-acetyltransferase [Cohnella lupini]RED60243.1 putative GNAT family N-acyltransferase [Cohnella lupini]